MIEIKEHYLPIINFQNQILFDEPFVWASQNPGQKGEKIKRGLV